MQINLIFNLQNSHTGAPAGGGGGPGGQGRRCSGHEGARLRYVTGRGDQGELDGGLTLGGGRRQRPELRVNAGGLVLHGGAGFGRAQRRRRRAAGAAGGALGQRRRGGSALLWGGRRAPEAAAAWPAVAAPDTAAGWATMGSAGWLGAGPAGWVAGRGLRN
jgi:hypothetical protein